LLPSFPSFHPPPVPELIHSRHASFAFVATTNRAQRSAPQVQLRHHIDHEGSQMPLAKPVLHRGRKQVRRLSVHCFEMCAHARNTFPDSSKLILACWESPTGW